MVAVVALVAGVAAAGAASAVEPGPVAANEKMFDFSVCNRGRHAASVAISSLYAPGSNDYVVAGWWQVPGGACKKIGSYPRGHFYTHATASGGSWGRGDLKLCVETPGPFKRINMKGITCSTKLLRPFSHVEVTSAAYEWTLNP